MQIVKYVAGKTRGASKAAKKLARAANKIDKATNGALFDTSIARQIVPYANVAMGALTAYDSLVEELLGEQTHPQAHGASVAGVSNGLTVRRTKPKFSGTRGNIRIMHKELVSEVVMVTSMATSPTYASGTSIFQVNPSNRSLFPWLATIASSYDYYNFNRLTLVYVPVCATSQTGRVMIGFDPDGSDAIPTSRQALSSTYCSTECSAWGITSLECDIPHNLKWYNTDSTGSLLNFVQNQGQVFTGCWNGGAATVGELYVCYDVTLKDPQPSGSSVYESYGTATVLDVQFNQSAPAMISGISSNAIAVNFTATGIYLVSMFGGATAVSAPTVSGSATLKEGQFTNNASSAAVFAVVEVTGVGYSSAAGTITTGAVLTLNGLTSLAKWSVFVTPIDYNVDYIRT